MALLIALASHVAPANDAECVILLHGLARSASSMAKLERHFTRAGYVVANIDYPSRRHPIEVLAPLAVGEGLRRCRADAGRDARIHFVTHSMGGILVRQYLATHSIEALGRVVMMAPPNQGSEVVDALRDTPGFETLNGPAGFQLGTGPGSVPRQLGPVDYPVGILAGTATINLVLSQFLPNPDDGKVSVASTRVEGMTDLREIDASHPFIMRDPQAMAEALSFIRSGAFSAP